MNSYFYDKAKAGFTSGLFCTPVENIVYRGIRSFEKIGSFNS